MDASIEPVTEDGDFVWTPEDRAFAAIRPLRIREWLVPPIIVFALGTAVIVLLLGLAARSGWALPVSGWVAIGAGALAEGWAVVLLVWGHRAYASTEMSVSEANIRVRAICITVLSIAVMIVGELAVAVPIFAIGVVTGGGGVWLQRHVMNPDFPRDFRDRLDRVYLRCVLAMGTALALVSPLCVLIGLLLPSFPTRALSVYIGGGIVYVPAGMGVILWATLALRRASRRRTLGAADESPKS